MLVHALAGIAVLVHADWQVLVTLQEDKVSKGQQIEHMLL